MFGKYKTMREWAQKNPTYSVPRRELIHLCVIDDEGFIKDDLNRLKFNDIRVFEKFTDIKDYANYNVILCDIKGVGQDIDPKLDGIAVARDIKKNYPEKIVLQYSGQAVVEYDKHYYDNMIIDGFIEKTSSSKELADALDKYCAMLWDPIASWEYIEKNLRNLKIDNINIAVFEHYFVKSLEKKVNYIERKKDSEQFKNIFTVGLGIAQLAISVIQLVLGA